MRQIRLRQETDREKRRTPGRLHSPAGGSEDVVKRQKDRERQRQQTPESWASRRRETERQRETETERLREAARGPEATSPTSEGEPPSPPPRPFDSGSYAYSNAERETEVDRERERQWPREEYHADDAAEVGGDLSLRSLKLGHRELARRLDSMERLCSQERCYLVSLALWLSPSLSVSLPALVITGRRGSSWRQSCGTTAN